MAPQDALLQLITSLSPAQVLHASRILRGRKLELFRAMLTHGKFLQASLGPEIQQLSEANFAVIRTTLLAELTLLFSQPADPGAHQALIRERIAKANVLQRADKRRRAITTFEDALAIATRAEDWNEAARILAHIRLLLDDPDDPQQLQRATEVEDILSHIQLLRNVLMHARRAKGADHITLANRLQAIDQAIATVGQPTHARPGLHYHHAAAFAALFRNDQPLALHHLDQAHHCILRLKHMLSDPFVFEPAMAVELSRSVLAKQLRSAIEALQGLQDFLPLVPASNYRSRKALLLRVKWLEAGLAFENQDRALWEQVLITLLNEKDEDKYLAGTRAAIYTSLSSMAMAGGLPRLALQWFERAFALRKSISTARTFEVMGVVYLAAMITLKDWDGMDAHVPRVRNLPLRRGMPDGMLREFGLLCLSMANYPDQRRQRLVDFYESLGIDSATPKRDLDYDYFNLREWVRIQAELSIEGSDVL